MPVSTPKRAEWLIENPRDGTVLVHGKKIEYIDLPLEDWRQVILKQPGFTEYMANHLFHVGKDHQEGVFSGQNDVVEQIGGQPPQSLEDFIQENLVAFK